jgi:hypothetical protein
MRGNSLSWTWAHASSHQFSVCSLHRLQGVRVNSDLVPLLHEIGINAYPITLGQYQLSLTLFHKILPNPRVYCTLLWHSGTLRWSLSILDFDTHLFRFFQVLLVTTRHLFYWLLVDCCCRDELLLVTLSSVSNMLELRPFNYKLGILTFLLSEDLL